MSKEVRVLSKEEVTEIENIREEIENIVKMLLQVKFGPHASHGTYKLTKYLYEEFVNILEEEGCIDAKNASELRMTGSGFNVMPLEHRENEASYVLTCGFRETSLKLPHEMSNTDWELAKELEKCDKGEDDEL
jgi:hypothetical protein